MNTEVLLKQRSVVLFSLCVAALSSFAHSQTQTASQNFATVNFNAVVLQTAEAQRDLAALQSRFAPRQAQLQALNDQVDALRKQLADPAGKLSEAERAARTQSLESKDKQLQREAEDFRSDSQNESQQVFQRIAQKVYAFLQTYSQQHSYSAVIERGSDASPVVWYAADNVDITVQLIKAYNAQAGAATSRTPNNPNSTESPKLPQPLPESPTPKPQP